MRTNLYRIFVGFALYVMLGLLVSTSAWAVPIYTITDLGVLEPTYGHDSNALGINNSGDVVGTSDTSVGQRAFVYTAGGSMQDLGTLGGDQSHAWAINDAGYVVGVAQTSSGSGHAFLYPAGGSMQDLGTLGDAALNDSTALDINNLGDVVGVSSTASSPHAFLYPSGGSMQDLGTLEGTGTSWAYAINDSGDVVGWSDTSLGPSYWHAFLYPSGGTMQDLGTLGGTYSCAWDINNSGDVVGETKIPSPEGFVSGPVHAFLYSDDVMYDLNDLIFSDSEWSKWEELTHASAINDLGQIAGYGVMNGRTRAFLLTPVTEAVPVTEPSTLLLLGSASLFGAAFRKRFRRQD